MSIADEQAKASGYFQPLGIGEKHTIDLSLVAFVFPSTGCSRKMDIFNMNFSEMMKVLELECVTSQRESEPVPLL